MYKGSHVFFQLYYTSKVVEGRSIRGVTFPQLSLSINIDLLFPFFTVATGCLYSVEWNGEWNSGMNGMVD